MIDSARKVFPLRPNRWKIHCYHCFVLILYSLHQPRPQSVFSCLWNLCWYLTTTKKVGYSSVFIFCTFCGKTLILSQEFISVIHYDDVSFSDPLQKLNLSPPVKAHAFVTLGKYWVWTRCQMCLGQYWNIKSQSLLCKLFKSKLHH